MKLALYGFLAAAVLLPAGSFEVASIKPSEEPPTNSGMNSDKGLLRAHNVTLKRCIVGAYGIPAPQIAGGPKWLDELRFEIVAKADHNAGDTELMEMLQGLLADRFQLSLHHETQTVAGYALTVARGGIKAKAADPAAGSSTTSSRGRIDAKGCTMSRLIIRLSSVLGVPVSDATGLSGSFDINLQWIPDDALARSGAAGEVPQGPSLYTAIQEQLGLKLEARKVPVDMLVIDHAALPSEN